MSHFSVCKIQIKNPNTDLLKAVVEQIALEMKGQVCSEIRGWGRAKSKDYIIALKAPGMENGVGVKLNKDGVVELEADWMYISPENKKKLEEELTKMYTATAVAQVLRRMGYKTEAQKTQQQVIINAQN